MWVLHHARAPHRTESNDHLLNFVWKRKKKKILQWFQSLYCQLKVPCCQKHSNVFLFANHFLPQRLLYLMLWIFCRVKRNKVGIKKVVVFEYFIWLCLYWERGLFGNTQLLKTDNFATIKTEQFGGNKVWIISADHLTVLSEKKMQFH